MNRAALRPVRPILPAFLFLLVLTITGCPKRTDFKGPDTAPAALDSALAALDAGNYRQAEEALNWVIFNFPGSRQAADAQYWLADSYFRREQYTLAQTEFDFYLRSFPYGRFQEEAYYKTGVCWLRLAPSGARDQSPLLQAQEILSEFLTLYPDSELRPQVEQALAEIERRRNERDFAIARLYYRSDVHLSALVYYNYIAESLPPERWDPQDRLKFAICHAEAGDRDTARILLESLADDDNPPDIRRQARERLERL